MELSYLNSTVHNHSTLCDGKNTLEQMALAAWQQGFEVLGFTGHSHTPCDLEYCMSPSRTAKYKAEINRLKAMYKGKMNILCGLEWDQFSDDDRRGYDYWIGSVHYLCGPCTGRYYEIDFRPQDLMACMRDDFGGDGMAMVEAYFASVKEIAAQKPTILGHFDLIKKLNLVSTYFDENNPRYKQAALDALAECAKSVKVLEINTGGVARGYRSDFYPSAFLLKEWKALGGDVIITADAHSTENLRWGYEQAAEVAKAAGFDRVAVMNKDAGFDFCAI